MEKEQHTTKTEKTNNTEQSLSGNRENIPVQINIQRLTACLASPVVTIPPGLSKEDKRKLICNASIENIEQPSTRKDTIMLNDKNEPFLSKLYNDSIKQESFLKLKKILSYYDGPIMALYEIPAKIDTSLGDTSKLYLGVAISEMSKDFFWWYLLDLSIFGIKSEADFKLILDQEDPQKAVTLRDLTVNSRELLFYYNLYPDESELDRKVLTEVGVVKVTPELITNLDTNRLIATKASYFNHTAYLSAKLELNENL